MSLGTYLESELAENLNQIFGRSYNLDGITYKQRQSLLKLTRQVIKKETPSMDHVIKDIMVARNYIHHD